MQSNAVLLREHINALRVADQRFDAERDRRITEVGQEREKALKIKETADANALELAREIQKYKDAKANDLREQINSERGLYATKEDVEPLKTYIAGQMGRAGGVGSSFAVIFQIISSIASIGAIVSVAFLLSRN
jgi:mevalonate kinase